MNFTKKHRIGFELLQIMIVIAVIGMIVALAIPATAADDVGSVDMSVTNAWNAAIGNTTNVGNAVKIDKQERVGILMRNQGTAASTAEQIVQLKRGNDLDIYESNPPLSLRFTNALNGTTANISYFEIPPDLIANVDKLKIHWATNASATVNSTNCAVWIIKKAQR
jgi:competence protein ComGC